MPGAVSFEEVLDQTLRGTAVERPYHVGNTRLGTAAAYGFLSFDAALHGIRVGPQPPAGAGCFGWSTLLAAERPSAAADSDVPPLRTAAASSATRPTPPQSALTLKQRAALGDLRALGAQLSDHFSADELRREFRTLARRYHPDRHPDASDVSKTELSILFRRVRAAYTVLLRTV